jgi:hypothetical protein
LRNPAAVVRFCEPAKEEAEARRRAYGARSLNSLPVQVTGVADHQTARDLPFASKVLNDKGRAKTNLRGYSSRPTPYVETRHTACAGYIDAYAATPTRVAAASVVFSEWPVSVVVKMPPGC